MKKIVLFSGEGYTGTLEPRPVRNAELGKRLMYCSLSYSYPNLSFRS